MNLEMWKIVLTLAVTGGVTLGQELQGLYNIAQYHNVIVLFNICFLIVLNINLAALINSTMNTMSKCI